MDFQPSFLCNHRFARVFFVYFRLLLRCFIAKFGVQHRKLGEDYKDDFRDKRSAGFSPFLHRFAERFVGFFAAPSVSVFVRDSVCSCRDFGACRAVFQPCRKAQRGCFHIGRDCVRVYVCEYERRLDILLLFADKLVFNTYRGQKRRFRVSRYFVDCCSFVHIFRGRNSCTFHIRFKKNQVCS